MMGVHGSAKTVPCKRKCYKVQGGISWFGSIHVHVHTCTHTHTHTQTHVGRQQVGGDIGMPYS